ncbi:MAG: T9SS type A sorting domain-containing protein [Bacteroidia bacterium]|nr:T9SS type A sorting domain-containing protein [Bacteroidia bacterium]
MNKLVKQLALGLAMIGAASVHAQTYKTGFDTDEERKGWKEFRTGKKGNNGWAVEAGGFSSESKVINFAPTGTADKDTFFDWYVSPVLDFSQGGSIDSLYFNYFSYFGVFLPEQRVHVYALDGDQDPEKADSMVVLADFTSLYSGDDKLWRDTGSIAIPKLSSTSYIAFRFVGIDGWSSISFDGLQVTENGNSNVETPLQNEHKVTLYPNPSNGTVFLSNNSAEDHYTMQVYALTGEKVEEVELDNSNRFSLNLKSGQYIYTLTGSNGVATIPEKLILID